MDKISHERVQAFKKMYDEASQIYINNGGFLRNVGTDASPIMQMISFWVSTTPSQQIIEPNTVFMTETNQNVWNMANGIPPLGIFVNHSRSGNFMATLKETEDKRKILHISRFNAGQQINQINLWSADLILDEIEHNVAHFEGEFGNCAWNWDEQDMQIAYIAEPKDMDTLKTGTKYLEKQHWGERCNTVFSPIICVWKVTQGVNSSGNVQIYDAPLQAQLTPHKLVWTPGGSSLVFFALHNEKRLGKLLCNNRSGKLMILSIGTKKLLPMLAAEDDPCHNGTFDSFEGLSFSPDKNWLVFFARKADGPHNSGLALCKIKWNEQTRRSSIVIDIQQEEEIFSGFTGLYNVHVPSRAWIGENKFIFQSTIKCRTMIIIASISSDSWTIVESSKDSLAVGSFKLLDVFQNYVLAAYSALDQPPMLLLDNNFNKWDNPAQKKFEVNWLAINFGEFKPKWKYIKPTNENVELLLIQPHNTNGDLIVFAHGGPHSTSFNCWPEPYIQLFATSGYAVLFVNYTGSAGYGEKFLRNLLGQGGEIEVEDVHKAVRKIKQAYGYNSVYALGASYGGFIALHLVSKYADENNYKACAAINPILDLSTLTQLTDITDHPLSIGIGNISNILERSLTLDEYRDLYNQGPDLYGNPYFFCKLRIA